MPASASRVDNRLAPLGVALALLVAACTGTQGGEPTDSDLPSRPPYAGTPTKLQQWLSAKPRRVFVRVAQIPGQLLLLTVVEHGNVASNAAMGMGKGALGGLVSGADALRGHDCSGDSCVFLLFLIPSFVVIGGLIGGIEGAATAETNYKYYAQPELQESADDFRQAFAKSKLAAEIQRRTVAVGQAHSRHRFFADQQEKACADPRPECVNPQTDGIVDVSAPLVRFLGDSLKDHDLSLEVIVTAKVVFPANDGVWSTVPNEMSYESAEHPLAEWMADDFALFRAELAQAAADLSEDAVDHLFDWRAHRFVRSSYPRVAANAAEPETKTAAKDPELTLWGSIEGSESPADYHAYLDTHPIGRFPESVSVKSRTSTEEPTEGEELTGTEIAALYTEGQRAYENKDYVSAFKNWKVLADHGHAQAAFNIADMYDFAMGVPHSHAQAAFYYLMAAERGHAEAQYKIANRYDGGVGIGRSNLEALKWYLIALKSKQLSAKSRYRAEREVSYFISSRVFSDSEGAARRIMQRAEKLARDWRPTEGLATASLGNE